MRRLLPLALVAIAACAPAQPEPAAPPDPPLSPTVLAVKGDWGAGTAAQDQITSAMCAMREDTSFRYVVTTGDNFYDPDGEATANNYRDPESCLTDAADHRWRATWGNHDVSGGATASVLGARRFYHWRMPGVDMVMLDSNEAADATQRDWLRRTLASAAGPVKIAVFHHPPYTVGSIHRGDAAVKQNWVPLFEQYGVDLVLSGHAHLYERHAVRGIDYIVTGGGGRDLHSCARSASSLRICKRVFHFLLVEIDGRDLTVRAFRRDRVAFDRLDIRA